MPARGGSAVPPPPLSPTRKPWRPGSPIGCAWESPRNSRSTPLNISNDSTLFGTKEGMTMTEVVDRTSSSNRVAAETAATTQPVEPAPTVDVAALGELLLGKWAHIRHTARD